MTPLLRILSLLVLVLVWGQVVVVSVTQWQFQMELFELSPLICYLQKVLSWGGGEIGSEISVGITSKLLEGYRAVERITFRFKGEKPSP